MSLTCSCWHTLIIFAMSLYDSISPRASGVLPLNQGVQYMQAGLENPVTDRVLDDIGVGEVVIVDSAEYPVKVTVDPVAIAPVVLPIPLIVSK